MAERAPQLMMPVQDDEATRRFFVEALRANTDTMKALRDDIREEREDRKEDRRLLNDIHTRVVKIEAAGLNTQVADLTRRVDVLESKEDQKIGQVQNLNTLHKWVPTVAMLMVLLIAAVISGVVKA